MTVLHIESYRGVRFLIAEDHVFYDGRRVRRPAGDINTVIKKVRRWIDEAREDAALRPELSRLAASRAEADLAPLRAPAIGSMAFVHAMGRWRRGKVLKIGRTRAVVAFTTRSSSGRIFRKAVPATELRHESHSPGKEAQK